jgi:16S rRNA (cytidine1402-2'-O)-methyltransferase
MLYLVPTPIGNLEDMTLRAIRVLREADLILAEDTRTSRVLLDHYEIDTPLRSYHAHNEHRITQELVEGLAGGARYALITDTGTPGISDPGFLLVRACRQAGLAVQVLPGPTALVPALVASGLPSDRFFFEGFLPHKKGRRTRLAYLAQLPCTFVLFESPHRLLRCLRELAEHCGTDRPACVCRELTKVHEKIKCGSLTELRQYYDEGEGVAKGEIVVVVGGDH